MTKELTTGATNSQPLARPNRLMIILAVLSVCSASHIYSQPTLQEQKASGPLSLNVSIQTRTLCRGGSLKLDAQLTNTGTKSIAIDPRFVWYEISFAAFEGKANGAYLGKVRTIVGDPGPNDEAKPLVLRSGESFKDSRTVSLADKFFKETGTYTVDLTYGQFHETTDEPAMFTGTVKSNAIEFKITACKRRVRGKR